MSKKTRDRKNKFRFILLGSPFEDFGQFLRSNPEAGWSSMAKNHGSAFHFKGEPIHHDNQMNAKAKGLTA